MRGSADLSLAPEIPARIFSDCDYVQTREGIIFIVRGYYHDEKILAVPVYFPDEKGDRIGTDGRRYVRAIEEQRGRLISSLHPEYLEGTDYGVLLKREDIETHYRPRDALKQLIANGSLKGTSWEKLISALTEGMKIPMDDIGVYGSAIVGLKTSRSDIDLIVYGVENFLKLRKNFDELLKVPGASRLTEEDIAAGVSKSQKTHTFEKEMIEGIRRNRWADFSVDGKAVGIRFGYKDDEIPPNPITSPPINEISTEGFVTDSLHSNFMPRVVKFITKDGREFEVVTYYWLFFSCVNDGEEIEVLGTYRNDGTKEYITLDMPHHFIGAESKEQSF